MINEKKLIEDLKKNNFDILMTDAECFGLEKCTENVIELINEQQKVGEWIPCNKRLPEKYGSYLVAWKPLMMFDKTHPHFYEIVEFDPDDEALWIGSIEQAHGEYEILAWQPLPEPYKGECNEKERSV